MSPATPISQSAESGALINLTYISICMIPPDRRAAEIEALLQASLVRNSAQNIGGALLLTATHFVQTLEGTTPAVDGLFAAIDRDPRHRMVATIDRRVVAAPNFRRWSMACFASSLFMAKAVVRAVPGPGRATPRDIARLLRLMRELGADPPILH